MTRQPTIWAVDVRVSPVGHGPVEEVVEPLVGVVESIIEWRLHQEENIDLVWFPPLLIGNL